MTSTGAQRAPRPNRACACCFRACSSSRRNLPALTNAWSSDDRALDGKEVNALSGQCGSGLSKHHGTLFAHEVFERRRWRPAEPFDGLGHLIFRGLGRDGGSAQGARQLRQVLERVLIEATGERVGTPLFLRDLLVSDPARGGSRRTRLPGGARRRWRPTRRPARTGSSAACAGSGHPTTTATSPD